MRGRIAHISHSSLCSIMCEKCINQSEPSTNQSYQATILNQLLGVCSFTLELFFEENQLGKKWKRDQKQANKFVEINE